MQRNKLNVKYAQRATGDVITNRTDFMKTFSLAFSLLTLSLQISAASPPAGAIVGWGHNALYGCDGISLSQSSTGVVTIAGQILTNAVAIAAGSSRFALLSDGTVFGWGRNSIGETSGTEATNGLVKINGNVLNNVVSITSGGLSLKNDGTVVGWGSFSKEVPIGLSNIVAISGGFALKDDGTVVAWGRGLHEMNTVPAGLSNVVVVVGSLENLALKKDGTVFEWYGNSHLDHPAPTGLSNVVAIASGLVHHLALKSDGTVFGWGSRVASGVPSTTYYSSGVVELGGRVLSNVVAIAAGGNNSMALKNDGTVVAWGDNGFHQTDIPAGLSNVVAIAVGGNFCLAITTNRAVAEKFRH